MLSMKCAFAALVCCFTFGLAANAQETSKGEAKPRAADKEVMVVRKYKPDGSYDLLVSFVGKKETVGKIADGKLEVGTAVPVADADRIMNIIMCDIGNQMGLEEMQKGNYAQAEKHFSTALNLAQRVNDPNYSFRLTVTNLSGLFLQTGRVKDAEGGYRMLLNLPNSLSSTAPFERANVMDNLAQSLARQEKYIEAEQYNNQAMEIYEKLSPKPLKELAKCYGNRALMQMYQSKCDQAIGSVDKAIELAHKAGDTKYEADLYGNKATIYSKDHKDDLALQARKKAETIKNR